MIPYLADVFGAEKMSYVLFGLSQCLFPISFLYANENKFSPIQTSLVRGAATMLLNICIARYYKMGFDFKYDVNFNNVIKRNGTMVLHGLAMATAQFYLPLPIVYTISCSAPLYIFILDYFQNGVTINQFQFYALVIGLLGILCIVNIQLVKTLIDPNYKITTLFQNYDNTDPKQFTLYSCIFAGVMFLWAYALLRARTFHKQNHTHVNFHLGLLFVISSGILYPIRVHHPVPLYKLGIAFFLTGIPLGFCNLCFGAGIGLNKKTGTLFTLTFLSVLMSYVISYVRYGEQLSPTQILGSILTFIGMIGVIKCGKHHEQDPLMTTKYIGAKKLIELDVDVTMKAMQV